MTAAIALTLPAGLAVGGALGWLAGGRVLASRAAARVHPQGEPVPLFVTATMTIPLVAFGEPIIGVGAEMQGILRSSVIPPVTGDGGDGTDPTTGLSFGDPGDSPLDEQ